MKIKIEIEGGEVKFDILGVKGKKCMELGDVEKSLGSVKSLKKKKEYYEKEERAEKRRLRT